MTQNSPTQSPRIMKTLGFGVEIELAEITKSRMLKAIQSVVPGDIVQRRNSQGGRSCGVEAHADGRVWFAMLDPSIYSRNGEGAELVTPILKYNDIETLQEILRACRNGGRHFRNGDACAEVNKSCGIHIHVGTETMTIGAIKRFIKQVSKFEAVMHAALQIHPERIDDGYGRGYCRPIRSDIVAGIDKIKSLDDLNKAVFRRSYVVSRPEHYCDERYDGCNLVNIWRIGTIEGRWFNSTTHAGVLKAYIQLMLAMAEKAIISTRGSSKRREVTAGNVKFAARTFLSQHLKLNGPEFKTCRKHLTDHLEGNGAWVNGSAPTLDAAAEEANAWAAGERLDLITYTDEEIAAERDDAAIQRRREQHHRELLAEVDAHAAEEANAWAAGERTPQNSRLTVADWDAAVAAGHIDPAAFDAAAVAAVQRRAALLAEVDAHLDAEAAQLDEAAAVAAAATVTILTPEGGIYTPTNPEILAQVRANLAAHREANATDPNAIDARLGVFTDEEVAESIEDARMVAAGEW